MTEAERLEALWAGAFGDDVRRPQRRRAGQGRRPFWRERFMTRLGSPRRSRSAATSAATSAGSRSCSVPDNVAGVDVNERALALLRANYPGVDVRIAKARELPFEDGSFDLVFTTGVLIHQPPSRSSRR